MTTYDIAALVGILVAFGGGFLIGASHQRMMWCVCRVCGALQDHK